MLIATLGASRVLARDSLKGFTYTCPGCGREVILHKGTRVIHHFKHKPPVTCSLATGETTAHLKAKQQFYDHFKSLGYAPELEFAISANGVSVRADVYLVTPSGLPVAFEIQHTKLSPEEIARRTECYTKLGVAIIWIPLINLETQDISVEAGKWVVKQFTAKPHEKWINGFNYGEIWFYEPDDNSIWFCKLVACKLEVPYSEWYETGGSHQSVGGYTRNSKRWRRLEIIGRYALSEVEFIPVHRPASTIRDHYYPLCKRVKIVPKA